jgi:plastocyanin
MKKGIIPFHDHVSHGPVGLIKVVPDVENNGISVINVSDGHHIFEPAEVTVKPGDTIRWKIDTENKIRITSGNPPTTGHETHEDEEKTLITLEVRP